MKNREIDVREIVRSGSVSIAIKGHVLVISSEKRLFFFSLHGCNMIKAYGYKTKEDKVYIQCFDPDETRRINDLLLPALNIDLKVVQLIAETDWYETMRFIDDKLTPYSYDWMFQSGAMKKIAEYADGIGPWQPMIISDKSTPENLIISTMVAEAHQAGMEVHPYTFRDDPGRVPNYASSFDDLLDIFYNKADVDGIFTDYP